jgi:hypothetical protein
MKRFEDRATSPFRLFSGPTDDHRMPQIGAGRGVLPLPIRVAYLTLTYLPFCTSKRYIPPFTTSPFSSNESLPVTPS